MKKTMIFILTIVLSLCLLLGTMPLSVSAAQSYSVSVDCDYSKGSASSGLEPTNAVTAGTRMTIYVKPKIGYEVNEVYYINSGGSKIYLTNAGSAVPGQNQFFSYYFTMPSENVTVRVIFKDASKYRVTVRKPEHGTAAIKGAYTYSKEYLDLYPGVDTDVYLYPDDGYVLESIRLVRNSNGQNAAIGITSQYNTAHFDMPSYDATVIITYRPAVNYYDLTINQATGGYVYTIPSDRSVLEDQNMRIYVDVDEGYRLEELLVRQNDIFLTETEKVAFWYEFHMPSCNTTITPIFSERRKIEYIWLDAYGKVLDQKTGYDGREEPQTSVIPQKAADENGEYTFDHWEESLHTYNSVTYRPVFRDAVHEAEFQNVKLSQKSVYPDNEIYVSASLIDMSTLYRIDGKNVTISLIKNDETVCSQNVLTYVPYEEYNGDNVREYFSVPENTKAGIYTLRLYYNGEEGEAVHDTKITVLPQTGVNIAFTAPRQAAAGESFEVEGILTEDNGTPVANAEVIVHQKNYIGYERAKSDSEGKFKTNMSVKNEGLATISVRLTADQYLAEESEAPIYIYNEDHSVTISQSDHGSASADITSAKCGDTVTLTAKPDKGYMLKEWKVVSGNVSMDGSTFVMLTQDVEIKPVFEPSMHTVTIVLGDYGEDITVKVPYGVRFFNELDKESVFNTLFNMETDDYIFRDLTTKPLNEFADEEEYGDDAWKLLDTKVTSDMTVYAGFYKKIKNVDLTLLPPIVGTTVTVTQDDDTITQEPAPAITLAPDAHCTVSEYGATWFAENNEGIMFEGAFEKDKTYLAELILIPDFGYWLDDNTVVTANNAEVVESNGRMALFVVLSATPVGPYILGDANGDGYVTIGDVTAIQHHLAELETLDAAHLLAADVNQNGVTDITDATHLQMFLAEYFTESLIGTLIE